MGVPLLLQCPATSLSGLEVIGRCGCRSRFGSVAKVANRGIGRVAILMQHLPILCRQNAKVREVPTLARCSGHPFADLFGSASQTCGSVRRFPHRPGRPGTANRGLPRAYRVRSRSVPHILAITGSDHDNSFEVCQLRAQRAFFERPFGIRRA